MQSNQLRYLARPDGRLAYTVEGSGPLLIAVPGMGDLRSAYRELRAPLSGAGYRIATMDLRGHGDSDTTFAEHGDAVTGRDILALIEELGEPVIVLGSSMSASAATWAAAERPEAIGGLVLFGPFLREPMPNPAAQAAMRLLYRALFVRPWGAALWSKYYGVLNKGTQAPWLEEHRKDIRRSFGNPHRLASLRQLALQLNHAEVEVRLPSVSSPSLTFIGDQDPDFRSPQAELDWATDAISGRGILVPGAGHYPHAQRPDVVVPAVVSFLAGIRPTPQNPTPAVAEPTND